MVTEQKKSLKQFFVKVHLVPQLSLREFIILGRLNHQFQNSVKQCSVDRELEQWATNISVSTFLNRSLSGRINCLHMKVNKYFQTKEIKEIIQKMVDDGIREIRLSGDEFLTPISF